MTSTLLTPYRLAHDFQDPSTERAVIASISRQPALYWEFRDQIEAEAFVVERETWLEVAQAVAAEATPPPISWDSASDPHRSVERLVDLWHRRRLADLQERLAQALYDESRSARDILALFEAESARIPTAAHSPGAVTWAADLLSGVLQDAERRRQAREETGNPVLGLPTGLSSLDALLNGLNEGLHLLAGGPGMGKTTLALQVAAALSARAPVVYVTFENTPANLVLKSVCAQGDVNPQDVLRGWADLVALRLAAEQWRPVAEKLAVLEGSSQLTVGQVKAKALQAMNRHQTRQCLIVVDYLQLWAKAGEELRDLGTARERVEGLGGRLRELAMQLQVPVLALSSQNRAQGGYGTGKGTAALDSLKESGDLEYAADSVWFLTEPPDRTVAPPARAVDLTVAKNRHGDIGKVSLIFRPDRASMREVK